MKLINRSGFGIYFQLNNEEPVLLVGELSVDFKPGMRLAIYYTNYREQKGYLLDEIMFNDGTYVIDRKEYPPFPCLYFDFAHPEKTDYNEQQFVRVGDFLACVNQSYKGTQFRDEYLEMRLSNLVQSGVVTRSQLLAIISEMKPFH